MASAEALFHVHLADHLDRLGRQIHIRQRRIVDRLDRCLLLDMLVRLVPVLMPMMLDMKSFSHSR